MVSMHGRQLHGHNGVPPKLIKLVAGIVCNPLFYLLNECFVQSIFPSEIKLAQVT